MIVDSNFVQSCADYGPLEVVQKPTVPPGPSPDEPPDRLLLDPIGPTLVGIIRRPIDYSAPAVWSLGEHPTCIGYQPNKTTGVLFELKASVGTPKIAHASFWVISKFGVTPLYC